MIDIVRDYTAICLGSAQATTAKVVGGAQTGVHWVTTWGRPESVGDPAESPATHIAAVARAPRAISAHVQGEVDRMVGRLGLVSEAEVRALRQQVQRLERRIGDLRGDR